MSDWRVPLSALNYGPEEEAAILRVLRSGWISMGPEIQAFEREFAELQGARHAIAVANGTAALHLALAALDLGPGDEVIQPALNFVAAANMTAAVGATPVFADVLGLDEPTIDPAQVETLITPRTRAVVVMHYGGYLCRMAELAELCRSRGLRLVEDACHALGAASADGRMAGSIGDLGLFSFFSNKNLATGEGGMVVTDDDALAARVRLLRSHGMTSLSWDRDKGHARGYEVVLNGFNYRLDDLHAALGREQLKKLAAGNRRREALTDRYRCRLGQSPEWIVPFADERSASAYHLFAVVARDAQQRAEAVARLEAARIQSSFHYPSMADFSAFAGLESTQTPNSDAFAARVITLPLHPSLRDEEVDEVCKVLLGGLDEGDR